MISTLKDSSDNILLTDEVSFEICFEKIGRIKFQKNDSVILMNPYWIFFLESDDRNRAIAWHVQKKDNFLLQM